MAGNAQRGRRGNVFVTGLSFGLLLGFTALSVDVALVRLAASQLQAALDAAALSGASELDGTASGLVEAKLRAQAVASQNTMIDHPVLVTLSQVELGTYDAASGTFTLYTGGDTKPVNAVRVAHAPPQVSSVVGAVFGVEGYDLRSRSMAIRPPGAGVARQTECFLPLAVPDCWVSSTPPGTNPSPLKFSFSPTPTDAIAYGSPDGNPSVTSIGQQLVGQCSTDPIEVGDPIYTNEGLHEPVLTLVAKILNREGPIPPSTWDESLYGPIPLRLGTADTANLPYPKSGVRFANWRNVIEGPVALVDGGPDCDAVEFGGAPMPMTGVAWAIIYDVDPISLDRNLYIQLDLVNSHEVWGEVDEDGIGNVLAPGESMLVAW